MPKNDQNQDKNDPIKESIDNNVCGTCRANGLPPPCQGHGGGGGGGSSGGGNEDRKERTDMYTQTNSSRQIDIAFSYLLQNVNWTQESILDRALVFTKPDALLTLKIDGENGVLIFRGNLGLSKDLEKILHEFYKKIINEFDEFKKENRMTDKNFVAVNSGNTLTLMMPNKKLYDLFVERLIAKNLIATPANLTSAQDFQPKREDATKDSRSYPNPFDISKGPRPKRWKDEE